MPDIKTFWRADASAGGWAVDGPGLAAGDDLETAVILSLFTDQRAEDDDPLPQGETDRRGWWGDEGRDRPLGSKLWLLDRRKHDTETLRTAEEYMRDALAWMVDQGVAARVDVAAEWQGPTFLAASIVIFQTDGTQRPFAYQWAWGN